MTDDLADGYFGESVAARYDETAAHLFDPAVLEPTVEFLAQRAGSGRALELGIGTGRVALPLAARGIPVLGITIGDFATAKAEGTFSLAYLLRNTIMNLTTQAAQNACFKNVAAHLEPGGRFVIEVVVPDVQRLPPGERFHVFAWDEAHQGIDEYDVATQGLISHHFRVTDGAIELRSIPFRYAWPAGLDLMAELAGLVLSERWSGWTGEPFTNDSREHVSVWEKPGS